MPIVIAEKLGITPPVDHDTQGSLGFGAGQMIFKFHLETLARRAVPARSSRMRFMWAASGTKFSRCSLKTRLRSSVSASAKTRPAAVSFSLFSFNSANSRM